MKSCEFSTFFKRKKGKIWNFIVRSSYLQFLNWTNRTVLQMYYLKDFGPYHKECLGIKSMGPGHVHQEVSVLQTAARPGKFVSISCRASFLAFCLVLRNTEKSDFHKSLWTCTSLEMFPLAFSFSKDFSSVFPLYCSIHWNHLIFAQQIVAVMIILL